MILHVQTVSTFGWRVNVT